MTRAELLDQFLAEVWGRPYQLGQWDCILFIAAWADRLMAASDGAPTSVGLNSPAPTITAAFRNTYTTEAEAIRLHARNGINLAIATTLITRGWHEVPIRRRDIPVPGCFQPGDIILTDLHHPGVWNGSAIVAQPSRSTGLLHLHPRHSRLGRRWPC